MTQKSQLKGQSHEIKEDNRITEGRITRRLTAREHNVMVSVSFVLLYTFLLTLNTKPALDNTKDNRDDQYA